MTTHGGADQAVEVDLPKSVRDRLDKLLQVNTLDFRAMALAAGLDPATSFRGKVLRDIHFGASNLDGFDFSGADLTGCDFSQALRGTAIFTDACLVGVLGLAGASAGKEEVKPTPQQQPEQKNVGYVVEVLRERLRQAKSPSTPNDVLAKLVIDKHPKVRRFATRNKSLPEYLINDLSYSPASEVRRSVALNVSTPPKTLSRLSRDISPKVRRAVAHHRATPSEILALLANDPDTETRKRASQRLEKSADSLFRDRTTDKRASLREAIRTYQILESGETGLFRTNFFGTNFFTPRKKILG